jgi:hypothetical protein
LNVVYLIDDLTVLVFRFFYHTTISNECEKIYLQEYCQAGKEADAAAKKSSSIAKGNRCIKR